MVQRKPYIVTLKSGKKIRAKDKTSAEQLIAIRNDIKNVKPANVRSKVVKKGKYYGVFVDGSLLRVETNKAKARKLAGEFR